MNVGKFVVFARAGTLPRRTSSTLNQDNIEQSVSVCVCAHSLALAYLKRGTKQKILLHAKLEAAADFYLCAALPPPRANITPFMLLLLLMLRWEISAKCAAWHSRICAISHYTFTPRRPSQIKNYCTFLYTLLTFRSLACDVGALMLYNWPKHSRKHIRLAKLNSRRSPIASASPDVKSIETCFSLEFQFNFTFLLV
jgi:hypothetical protein